VPYRITDAAAALNPRTPVIVGVGQSSEQIGDPSYRGLSPVELGAAATRAAIEDAGVGASTIVSRIDTVAGVRQFETSSPTAPAPLGRSNNFPRAVTGRVGANPRRAILDVAGGQSPRARAK
jgi:acetyl-CoA C-acetyltransferase